MAESMSIGLSTTGLGLLVTFITLIFLIIVIVILSAVAGEKKKDVDKTQEMPETVAEPEIETIQASEDELIAVLTAAAAYVMRGDTQQTAGLVVRSYRKVDSESDWGKAGRNSQIFNKF